MENPKVIYLEIRDLIKQNPDNLIDLLEEYHFYDISQAVTLLEPSEIKVFFSLIPLDYQASIFEYMEEDDSEDLIEYLPDELLVKIIDNMDIDEAVDLLKYLDDSVGIKLLNKFPQKKRKELIKIMAYKESQIGAFMTDSFFTIELPMTVKDTMRKVTDEAYKVEYISILYVTKEHKLVGYLKLKDLIVARANESIEDIMETRFPEVYPTEDKEKVLTIMNETNESSLPIIDTNYHLQGIITHDDLMDIAQLVEEEDYTKFAAISQEEVDLEAANLKASVKSRLPWLTILLGLSMVTSIILSLFQRQLTGSDGAILLAAKLAVYLPLIQGMAGNTGTQSLAVMIRYLTKNDDLDNKDIKKHLLREIKTGFFNGLIIGVLVFIMINLTTYIIVGNIVNRDLIYAIVASMSIFIALNLSTILGAVIPLMMNKLHIDPAVASGPFITTVSDVITMTVYYAVSLSILLPLFI